MHGTGAGTPLGWGFLVPPPFSFCDDVAMKQALPIASAASKSGSSVDCGSGRPKIGRGQKFAGGR